MTKINDGGKAFPKTGSYHPDGSADYDSYNEDGMLLRDYFAAKAMQGICAHPDNCGLQICEIALRAYGMADAMLAEREKVRE
jgi:hypothetical protein